MRILMFSWEYPPYVVGGLGRHVAELAPALARQGVEVHLVTPRFEGATDMVEENGLHVHRVYVHQPAEFDFYNGVVQANDTFFAHAHHIARSLQFDLIHAHDWLAVFAAVRIKHDLKQPLIATVHATEQGRGNGNLHTDMARRIHHAEWWLTYEAWRVIACSHYMANQVRDYFNVPSDKIDVIPNGVNVHHYDRHRDQDLDAFRNRFALPEEDVIFSVGRLVEEKGFHLLIEAAPRVLAGHPEAKFVIAGRGPLRERLTRQAHELGVGHKVLFTGFLPDSDRDRLFLVARVAVFPSLYEPFGIVALEAMAAGCPVVVTSVGGLQEVVTHEVTGVTVYPDNVHSLAWGILHVLKNYDRARVWARNARRLVEEEYNWDHIASQTVHVYERAVEERQHVVW